VVRPLSVLPVALGLVVALVGCGDSTKPDATPPAAVTDLSVASVGDSSVTLTWTAPGDDGEKGQAAAYDLRYGRFSVLEYWKIAFPAPTPVPGPAGTTDSVVVSGLKEDTGYKFALRTVDDAGNWSGLSNMASVPPSAITDLMATVLSHHVVELHWTAPGDDWDQGTVTGYDIRYATGPLAEASWATYSRALFAQSPVDGGKEQTFDLGGLVPSTSYWMAVRGYDEGGNLGGISNVVTATTPADTIPPAAVTDLAAGAETEHSITLAWTAPGDDGTEGQAASYDVRYSMQPITEATWGAATPAAVPFAPAQAGAHEALTVGALEPRVVYSFALKTADLAGNLSGLSNVVELETAGTRTWRVLADGTGDAPTIQAAIELAKDGDLVLVEPGTYYENVNLRGKAIHLRGDEGPEVTILDGTYGDSSVVVCDSGETNRTIIEGLTITHGKGTVLSGGGREAAGILCSHAAPIIRNDIIRENRSVSPQGGSLSWGGAISYYSQDDILLLEDNLIESNFSSTNAGGLNLGAPCIVRRNVIHANITEHGDGGGLRLVGWAKIQQNVFLANQAGDHGGGMYVINDGPADNVDISGNLFVSNHAHGGDHISDCSGGAIWIDGAANIHGNTMVFNEAESRVYPAAGGICLKQPRSGMLVERNIIYNNVEGGLVATQLSAQKWGVAVWRNIFFQNDGQDIYNAFPGTITLDLQENVFEDPLFCDPTIDTRGELAGTSPALNQPYGVIGAVAEPGCGPYAGTWGSIRRLMGSGAP